MTERESKGDELRELNFNLHPNEASGLLSVKDESLLEAHDWDVAFWAVLDEGEIEDCVAVIGHRRGSGTDGWEIDRFHAEPVGDGGKTEDAEAITRSGDWVYAIGSHFGSKDGPLQPKRGFFARFRESEVEHAFKDPAVRMEIYRDSFVMHRLINDAIRSSGPDLIPVGEQTEKALISGTIERGEDKDKKWSGLVREGDYPLNFEGAAFRGDGSLLLGLRFPVAADGSAVLLEVSGIERLFEPGNGLPEVEGFWTVDAGGRGGALAGVRDLALRDAGDGEELHLVTGNIDSKKGGSVLIQDYPSGRDTVATHSRCTLPKDQHSGSLEAEFIREFPGMPRVEGIAITDDGDFFYVTDEDEGVHLRLTSLLSSESG